MFAILEKQPFRASDRSGAIATFKKAEAAAYWEMALVCAGIPYATVMPHVWIPKMGIPAHSDKGVHRQIAQREFPGTSKFTRVKDDGRADAALIALYAYRKAHGHSPPNDYVEVYVLGIDPGLTGAMAVLDSNGLFVEVFDAPTFLLKAGSEAKGHDLPGIWTLVKRAKNDLQAKFAAMLGAGDEE